MFNALKTADTIGSKTWSLFWGLIGATPDAQIDGSLIFEAYDLAKIDGSNSTGKISVGQGCDRPVTFVSITMNFPNATDFQRLGESHGAALRICIEPSFPIIPVPYDIWMTF